MFLGGLFHLLISVETGMSALQVSYKIYNFTVGLSVSLHYLIKTKNT